MHVLMLLREMGLDPAKRSGSTRGGLVRERVTLERVRSRGV
jgi:hypothetical protein